MKLDIRSLWVVCVLSAGACSGDDTSEQGPEGGTSTGAGTSSSESTSSTGQPGSSSTGGDVSSSSTTDEPGGISGHSCPEDCCEDAVAFVIEDARETFTLTFELPGLLVEPVVACPAGAVEGDVGWLAECSGGEVTINADGSYFSSSALNEVRLDDGEPQVFGDELGFIDCDCNCQPVDGTVTVLIDPTAGTGSTGTGTGSTSTGG